MYGGMLDSLAWFDEDFVQLSASGQTKTLGVATEVDTAQTLTKTKTIVKSLGVATNVNTAQTLSVVKPIRKTLGIATGLSTAQPAVLTKRVTIRYAGGGGPYVSTITADSPSMYWRVGEAVGATTAADSSGNGRTGTYGSALTLGQTGALVRDLDTSILGTASATSKITATSYNPFVNGAAQTFEGWAKRTDTAQLDTLFSAAGATSARLLLANGSQNVSWRADHTVGSSSIWTNAWPGNGVWVHWALIFNEPADTAELFINGVSQGVITNTDVYGASVGVVVFGINVAVNGQAWRGYLDEFVIYPFALSAAQIRSHYEAGAYGDAAVPLRIRPWLGKGTTPSTAQPLSVVKPILKTLGVATNLNTAQPVDADKVVRWQTRDYINQALTLSPALHWRLGDTGATAEDETANNRDGTYGSVLTKNQTSLVGDGNGSVLFAATQNANSKVTSSYNPFTGNLTVTGWAQWNGSHTEGALFGSTNTTNTAWMIGASSGRTIYFTPNDNITSASWPNQLPANDVTFHWALTWNNTTFATELFINGESKGSKTLASGWSTPGNFVVGYADVFSGDDSWPGLIDEVSVFTSVLTASQIRQLYLAGSGGPGTGLAPNTAPPLPHVKPKTLGIATTANAAQTLTVTKPIKKTLGITTNINGALSGITPRQVTNKHLWLDSSQLNLNNNDPVGTWTDAGGTYPDFTQATALSRPVYKTNVQNGQPGVLFGGTSTTPDQFLTSTGTALPSTAWSMFMVFRFDDTFTGTWGTILSEATAVDAGLYAHIDKLNFYNNAAQIESTVAMADDVTLSYSLSDNGTNIVSFRRNGLLETTTGNATHRAWKPMYLGSDEFQEAFGGYIFELVLLQGVPGESTRLSLENYQGYKYGLAHGTTAVKPAKSLSIAPASTANAAQSLTATKPIVKTLGVASTANAAQPVTFTKTIRKTLGFATNVNTPLTLSITHVMFRTITSGAEASTAQPLKVRPWLGKATTPSSARPLTVTKTIIKSLTAATQTNSAQTLSVSKEQDAFITQATQPNAAQSLSVTKTIRKTITVASTANAAQSLTVTKPIPKTLGVATTANFGQTLSVAKVIQKTLVFASQTDTPLTLGITHVHVKTLASATEADTSQPLTTGLYLGTVQETDHAGSLRAPKLGTTAEADAAQSLVVTHAINRTLTPAEEVESAIVSVGQIDKVITVRLPRKLVPF